MIAALGLFYQLTWFFVAWMLASVLFVAGLCWLVRRFPPPDDLVHEVEQHPETRARRAIGGRHG
jgi:4-hydroxybenzoate polyprenyltransferase